MSRALALLQQGGPTMVPLMLCSVLALAVVIDRAWSLRRSAVLPPALLDFARNYQPGTNLDLSRALCDRYPGPFALVIWAIINDPAADGGLATEQAQAAGRRAVRLLERGIVLLEIVAGISPLLGLFGTVLGMFHTFRIIAEQGVGNVGALSGGISEALLTTIVGLGVAIPTVVAYSFFAKRVDDLVLEIEDHGARILQRLYPDGRTLATTRKADA